MKDQYCYLTYSDKGTDQKTIEDPRLSGLLNRLDITNTVTLRNDLQPVFLHASARKGHVFLDFEYSSHTMKKRNIDVRTPVFGAKGRVLIERRTNYAQVFFSTEEDFYGPGFFESVFGIDYIRQEEVTELTGTQLQERLTSERLPVSFEIPEQDREFICRIVLRIWEILEQNPSTRIVLEMEQAETGSMELLRELYLMMPHRLRLQNGFMTNIELSDLDRISQGIPIYILTAEPGEIQREDHKFASPVEIIDVAGIRETPCDQKRLELLKVLCAHMDHRLCLCLSFAEQVVLEEHESNASSFRYYEEIVRRVFDDKLYWWNQAQLRTVEELYGAYQKQQPLMKDSEIEKSALQAFYMERMPESNYAEQTIRILRDEQYPDREKYLQFLGTSLYADTQIDAAAALIRTMEDEKAEQTETALAEQKRTLDAEHESCMDEQQKKYEAEVTDREQKLAKSKQSAAECQKKLEESEARGRDLQEKLSETEGYLERLRARSAENQREIEDLHRRLKDGGVLRAEELQKDYAQREAALSEQLAQAAGNLTEEQEQSGKLRKKGNILLGLTIAGIVLAAAGIGGTIYGLKQSSSAEERLMELETENEALQSEKTQLESANTAMSESNEALMEQVSSLESEKESMAAQTEPARTAGITANGSGYGTGQTEQGVVVRTPGTQPGGPSENTSQTNGSGTQPGATETESGGTAGQPESGAAPSGTTDITSGNEDALNTQSEGSGSDGTGDTAGEPVVEILDADGGMEVTYNGEPVDLR